MSRYDGLTEALRGRSEPVVTLTFAEIDRLVGGLPASARKHTAWWSNSRMSRPHSRYWLDAGRRATVEFNAGQVRFVAAGAPRRQVARLSDDSSQIESQTKASPALTPHEARSGGALRIGLVGCVKPKAPVSRPAGDLYVSTLFVGRRRFVEGSCSEWWILSALHGLLHPDDIVEPYDLALQDLSRPQRRVWASQVLHSIDERVRTAPGDAFEIHAGADYRDFGLVAGLRARGYAVANPTEGMPIGKQLQFYGTGAL